MIKFSPSIPGHFDLGFLEIRFYAVCILLGGLVALFYSKKGAKAMGINPNKIDYVFYPAFASGILGARLWYVIAQWGREFSFDNFGQVFNFSAGGLAIQGGVICGIIVGVIIFLKVIKNKSLRLFADYAVISILVAQAIGRLGNFFNHEVFGRCVARNSLNFLPGFILDNVAPPGTCSTGEVAVPLFLVEGLANLAMFFFLGYFIRKIYTKTKIYRNGDFVAFYFIWYGTLRALLEKLRSPEYIMGNSGSFLPISVITSLSFVAIGILILLILRMYRLPFKKKLIIFDLDGTILDNNDFIINCYKRLFEKYRPDYQLSKAEEIALLGPPLKEMLEIYFSQDSNLLLQEYRTIGEDLRTQIKLFPGAKEALETIKNKDIKLALVSTKVHKPVMKNLQEFGIEDYFSIVIGGDDVSNVKPSPEGINKVIKAVNKGINFFDKKRVHRWNVVMIGDSQSDLLAAQKAFVVSCGVYWTKKLHTLTEVAPDYLVANFDEIIRRFGK